MDDFKVNIRFPEILHVRLKKEVERRQETVAAFSFNALVLEACRALIDGPSNDPIRVDYGRPAPTAPRKTAAELAAMIPGVQVGIPDQGTFTVVDEWEDKCRAEFRPQLLIAPRKFRAWSRWDWEQRYNALVEQREQEAGS